MKYLILAALILAGCTKIPTQSPTPPPVTAPTPTPTPSPTPSPTPTPTESLSWEKNHSERQAWSKSLRSAIDVEWSKLSKASDMNRVCENYESLSESQKKRMWAEFFVAMAYYESAWKPTSWMKEDMGLDPITGRQVRSEGLLQLSYQDEKNYGIECGFEWAKDKSLGDNDPTKTIFSPHLNLTCGVKIMGILTQKYKEAFLMSPYWSVIRDGVKIYKNADGSWCAENSKGICRNTQLPNVVARTKAALNFCQ